MIFKIGQRWISNTESQLGLGIITHLASRQVTIRFPAAEEERIYAMDSAPLTRIAYKEGDLITTVEQQQLTVKQVNDYEGILFYTGIDSEDQEQQISELSLDAFIKLNSPKQRLLSGLLDKANAFQLRIATLYHQAQLAQAPCQGLIGSRTSHLPHQVYIAHEVAQRYAPRVLLADEVGLGKTIEAGMILHAQLQTGRAQRVLIVVPNSLIHQWLVEMIRRFNMYFSIIDEERFAAEWIDEDSELERQQSAENYFEAEQLVLCSLEFLVNHAQARQQALASSWDLMVVDEAHHLQWSEDKVSLQYACIEQLAQRSKGLLLLTATPEQVGIESHFARLRLLDPARFHDLAQFLDEEAQYQQLNQLVQELLQHQQQEQTSTLPPALQQKLNDYLGEHVAPTIAESIKYLLDRHGTGRVLFRNTRAAITGFPARHVNAYPLPLPSLYTELTHHLTPEQQCLPELWLNADPRVLWLAEQITALSPNKILIICAKAKTAISLEQQLKLKYGFRSTVFHEGLTIIERDRAAAYFAEEEQGAQVLICSEIGSEGRNFQFAHHLVLFDLPLNPDLLEQRIGRLDRLGQRHEISIHVPYIEHTAQEILFHWYHEGMNLFNKSCSIGYSIYQQFAQQLFECLADRTRLAALIEATRNYMQKIQHILHEGRDRLLELNSCDPVRAKELIHELENAEHVLALEEYMAQVFQEFGIDHEYHSELTEILHPTDHMKISHFPGLKEEGTTVTYSRPKALIREDMEFLTWEHPMVQESMEMIVDSELGNAHVTTIAIKTIPAGTLFVEAFFTLNCAAPKHLQLNRFIPLTPIRIFMDASGKNLSNVVSFKQLNGMSQHLKRHIARTLISKLREPLEQMLQNCQRSAEEQLPTLVLEARQAMNTALGTERNRLLALQKMNPNIRQDEVNAINEQITASDYYLNNTTLQLQAIRMVINKPE